MFESYKDSEFLSKVVPELRTEFKKDVDSLKEFNPKALPTTMTPADMEALYTAQAYISTWLFTFSTFVAKWHRVSIEATALKTLRETQEKRGTFKYIVDHANDKEIISLKSEAQKLQVASDNLQLPGIAGIEYLSDLTKGYYSYMNTSYARVERQADAILTHLSILKSKQS